MYYRIQNNAPDDDFVGRHHQSWQWVDMGAGPRAGVSCCRCLQDLLDYFAYRDDGFEGGRSSVGNLSTAVLVVFNGKLSADADHDHTADGSPLLVHPESVEDVRTLTPQEVYAAHWREPVDHLPDGVDRLNALADAYGREVAESLIEWDLSDWAHDYDSLAELGVDDGYVVARDSRGRQLVWDAQLAAYAIP